MYPEDILFKLFECETANSWSMIVLKREKLQQNIWSRRALINVEKLKDTSMNKRAVVATVFLAAAVSIVTFSRIESTCSDPIRQPHSLDFYQDQG